MIRRVIATAMFFFLLASLSQAMTWEELGARYNEEYCFWVINKWEAEERGEEVPKFSSSLSDSVTWEMALVALDSLGNFSDSLTTMMPNWKEGIKRRWNEDDEFKDVLQRLFIQRMSLTVSSSSYFQDLTMFSDVERLTLLIKQAILGELVRIGFDKLENILKKGEKMFKETGLEE